MSDPLDPEKQLKRLRAGALHGVARLDLCCGLTEIPPEVFNLADSLEVLNLSGNRLTHLPDEFAKLKKLKIVFCSNNQFTHIPEVLGECESLSMVGFKACAVEQVSTDALPPKLQWLILTDNRIKQLPDGIGSRKHLQKCMLAGNQLSALPEDMQFCHKLELLRISANQFESLPSWLLELPRLSWLALAGNPFNQALETQVIDRSGLCEINWDDLDIQYSLGEGASGIIYRAVWRKSPVSAEDVAVKIFKGSVTSDGLPESEMAAFIAAGHHYNLSSVEGVLSGHPQTRQGIVMSLIDPEFNVLANPPSFDSCTRDVYDAGQSMVPANVVSVALGVARAAEHLHGKGMMHGDLYGHNILHDRQGRCILSDFGGASFVPGDKLKLDAFARIEVRAFSCLLEELLNLCSDSHSVPSFNALFDLQRACADENPGRRPLFSDVVKQLMEVQQSIPVSVIAADG